MTRTLEDRWTELKLEIDKLKAEAALRGEKAKQAASTWIEDLESKAGQVKDKLSAASEAGSSEAGESRDHLEKAFDSAKDAVQSAWRKLRE